MDKDWDYEFAFGSVNFCFLTLKQILTALVEQSVPVTGGVPASPWRVHPSRALKMVQKRAWDVYKDTRQLHGRQHDLSVELLIDLIERIMIFVIILLLVVVHKRS